MNSILVDRIKEKMGQKRYTVASLEREAGLKVHAIRNILLGKSKNPSADTVKAISEALDCSIDELLSSNPVTASENEINETSNELSKIDDPDLLSQVLEKVFELFKSNNKVPTYKELSFMMLEVYLYSIENNKRQVDDSFMQWLYSRNF